MRICYCYIRLPSSTLINLCTILLFQPSTLCSRKLLQLARRRARIALGLREPEAVALEVKRGVYVGEPDKAHAVEVVALVYQLDAQLAQAGLGGLRVRELLGEAQLVEAERHLDRVVVEAHDELIARVELAALDGRLDTALARVEGDVERLGHDLDDGSGQNQVDAAGVEEGKGLVGGEAEVDEVARGRVAGGTTGAAFVASILPIASILATISTLVAIVSTLATIATSIASVASVASISIAAIAALLAILAVTSITTFATFAIATVLTILAVTSIATILSIFAVLTAASIVSVAAASTTLTVTATFAAFATLTVAATFATFTALTIAASRTISTVCTISILAVFFRRALALSAIGLLGCDLLMGVGALCFGLDLAVPVGARRLGCDLDPAGAAAAEGALQAHARALLLLAGRCLLVAAAHVQGHGGHLDDKVGNLAIGRPVDGDLLQLAVKLGAVDAAKEDAAVGKSYSHILELVSLFPEP